MKNKLRIIALGLLSSASGAGDLQANVFPLLFSLSSQQTFGKVGGQVATSSTRFFIKRTGIVLGVAGAAYLIYRFVRRARRFQVRQSSFIHNLKVQVEKELLLDLPVQQTKQMTTISEKEFRAALDDIQKVLSNRYGAMAWLEEAHPPVTARGHILITQKIMLPEHADVRFVGDIHGEADALDDFFKKLQEQNVVDADLVLKKDAYYVFLGDYVDRGENGVAVLCLLSKFLKNNPQRVFLLRGNHEDLAINSGFGFYSELLKRFDNSFDTDILTALPTVYNLLPSALFLGYQKPDGTIGYIVCCHGSLEFGYHPQELLLHQGDNVGQWVKQLSKKKFFDNLDQRIKKTLVGETNIEEATSSTTARQNQFMWGRQTSLDWPIVASEWGINFGPMMFNAVANAWQLPGKFSIDAVMRGHDHEAGVVDREFGFQMMAEYNLPFFTIISTCSLGVRPQNIPQKYQFTYMQLTIDNGLVFTPTVIR